MFILILIMWPTPVMRSAVAGYRISPRTKPSCDLAGLRGFVALARRWLSLRSGPWCHHMTPVPVQSALLLLVAAFLRPAGLGYCPYKTYPAC